MWGQIIEILFIVVTTVPIKWETQRNNRFAWLDLLWMFFVLVFSYMAWWKRRSAKSLAAVRNSISVSVSRGVVQKEAPQRRANLPQTRQVQFKTRKLINKQHPTINSQAHRNLKWKNAFCRPRAPEEKSWGERINSVAARRLSGHSADAGLPG